MGMVFQHLSKMIVYDGEGTKHPVRLPFTANMRGSNLVLRDTPAKLVMAESSRLSGKNSSIL